MPVNGSITQAAAQNRQLKTMNQKKLKRRIRECEAEIANIRSLPYYTVFNRESEREADLKEAINKLAVIREKYSGALKIVYGCRLPVDGNFTQTRRPATINRQPIQFFNY